MTLDLLNLFARDISIFFMVCPTLGVEHSGNRVATDLENLEKSGSLKETSESQGICLKSQGICLKSQGICDRIPKVRGKSGDFVV